MTGHIPETFIDELLTRVDIVDIIQGRIELKRAGANFLARCPFHAEKTPSFTVSQNKQFYHCFGCGAHGTAIKFLMEYDGLHFVDAVETLANRLGLTIPRDAKDATEIEKAKSHSEIFAILEAASAFYQKELLEAPLHEKAIEYLKNRGITKETILDFQIGYARSGWDTLFKALGKNKTSIEHLLAAGLIIAKESKPYFDRFRDRIMFPIRNRRGKVVGFGGRVLQRNSQVSPESGHPSHNHLSSHHLGSNHPGSNLQDSSPKYLNSPETKVFSKSHELYGLYEARLKLKKLQTLIVVEGYLDVLTLSQYGFKHVVATLGTSLTEKHLEILFREVPELTICFDGDTAGREAARRVLLLSLPMMKEGRRLRFVFLPEKEDPDSFVRKQGTKSFEACLQNAKTLTDYLFESHSTNLDLNQVEGRAEYIRRLRPLIAKVPSEILQHMLYERLAETAKVSLDKIENPSQHLHKTGQQSGFKPRTQGISSGFERTGSPSRRGPIPPAYKATAFLLANPQLLRYIKTPHGLEQESAEPGMRVLCAMIDILLSESHLCTKGAFERLKTTLEEKGFSDKEISYIAGFDGMIASVPKEGFEAEFVGAIERLNERARDTALERLLAKAKTGPLSSQEKLELKDMLNQKEPRVDKPA